MGEEHTEHHVHTVFDIADKASEHLREISEKMEKVAEQGERVKHVLELVGVGFGFHEIMEAGEKFEKLQVGLAQTLKFMGEGGETFEDSMEHASDVMTQLIGDSMKLPGTADQYAKAIELSGSQVQAATGDFQKTKDLIEQTASVAMAMGESTEGAALKLNMMLGPVQGMMMQRGKFSQGILNAMRQLPGEAHLTVQAFGRLDLQKRLELVTKAMGQFDGLVNESAHGWGVIEAHTKFIGSLMTKEMGAPIFDGAKNALFAINNALIDAHGHFTPLASAVVNIGKLISENLVGGIQSAVHLVQKMGQGFDKIKNSAVFNSLGAAYDRVKSGGVAAGIGLKSGVGAAMKEGGSMLGGLGGGLAIGGFIDFITRAGQAARLLASLDHLLGALLTPLAPLIGIFDTLNTLVGDAFQTALIPVIDMFTTVIGPVADFASYVAEAAGFLLTQLRPAWDWMWGGVSDLAKGLSDFLYPIIVIVVGVLEAVVDVLAAVLLPVINVVALALGGLLKAVGKLLSFIGHAFKEVFHIEDRPGGASNRFSGLLEHLKNLGKMDEKKEGREKEARAVPESRGGGGKTVQDFRFSNFDIQQKFAEGFDPDRISVAFADDVRRIGEQKLQSGFEPMFGVR